MDSELRRDLDWFHEFLADFNGRSLIVDGEPTVSIEADSCLSRGGGCMGDRCYALVYPEGIASTMHIFQL